jgi:hypothetical protein
MWTHFTDSVPRSSALNMFAYESWTTKQLWICLYIYPKWLWLCVGVYSFCIAEYWG